MRVGLAVGDDLMEMTLCSASAAARAVGKAEVVARAVGKAEGGKAVGKAADRDGRPRTISIRT